MNDAWDAQQPDRIAYYFNLTHELPEVEFKGPAKALENPHFGRVVRAAIAMTNRRGGGVIIIGVAETAADLQFDGLTPDQLATWKYESIADGFNRHTSSRIEFEHQVFEYDGKSFIILNIREFDTIPVMCIEEYLDNSNVNVPKKDRKIVLSPFSFYIRTVNKPESKRMQTTDELRALYDLAIDKGIKSFVTRTRLAGIHIAPLPEDKELFDRQLQDWQGPFLTEIRSRGYWDIRIRPVTFQQERSPLSRLRELLMRVAVNYRGWEFPSITPETPKIGLDWIGSQNQQEYGLQAWRFFQSGQFVANVGFMDDWGDKLSYPYQGVPNPGEMLSALGVVYHLTEIYGLASRLAATELYNDERSIVIDLTLLKTQGRILNDRGTRMPVFSQRAEAEKIPYTVTLAKEDIIARSRQLVYEPARYIFERFGWNPSDQLLATIQSGLVSAPN